MRNWSPRLCVGLGLLAGVCAPAFGQAPPADSRSKLESLLRPGGTQPVAPRVRADLLSDVRMTKTGEMIEVMELATGHRVRGSCPACEVSRILSLDQLIWRGPVEITLARPHNGLPAGRYEVDAAGMRGLYPLRVTGAKMEPRSVTYADAPPKTQACPDPTVVPLGWMVWWPTCVAAGANGEGKVTTYAPQALISITEKFVNGQSQGFTVRHRGAGPDASHRIIEAMQAEANGTSLAILGEARMIENGQTVYRGTFAGMRPDGNGMCPLPAAEGTGEEQCAFAGGVRNDMLHRLRLQRVAEAKRQAEEAAALAEEQRQLAEAQRQAEYEAAAAERRYAEANKPDTLAIIAGAFVGAMQDLTVQRQREAEANRRFRADLEANRQRLQARQDAMNAAAEASRQRHEAQLAQQRAQMAANDQARQQALAEQAAANARAERARLAESQANAQRRAAEQQMSAANTATASMASSSGSSIGRQPGMATAPAQARRTYPPVPEALSGCQARGAGRFVCFTSSSGMGNSVGPNEASGWRTPEEWVNFVGQCPNRGSAINLNDGSVVWACGYGQSGNHQIDVAAKIGAQVQGRRTFYCDRSEVFCKRTSPGG